MTLILNFLDIGGAGFAISTGIIVLASILVIVFIIKNLLYICEPNELLIFSGRKRLTADGKIIGYRLIRGGRGIRIPFLEKVSRMSLEVIPIEVTVRNAYSRGGIPLNIQGIANVKIASTEPVVNNAIERFLSTSMATIKGISKETLEGNLRGVLATLTPEEINEDRLKFAETLVGEAEEDLSKLGLSLDTLKIQNVADDTGYLDSIGRVRTAEIIRKAEVAEVKNQAESAEQGAVSKQRGKVAEANSQKEIAIAENELRIKKAQLNAQSLVEEAKATVSGEKAKAIAEQELQTARLELEKRRLAADVVAPAEAKKQAQLLAAIGDAAHIIEQGKASAQSFRLMRDEFLKAGGNAKDIFILQKIEGIIKEITQAISNTEIKSLTVFDSGNGDAVSNSLNSLPKSIAGIMESIKGVTGLDIADMIASRDDNDQTNHQE